MRQVSSTDRPNDGADTANERLEKDLRPARFACGLVLSAGFVKLIELFSTYYQAIDSGEIRFPLLLSISSPRDKKDIDILDCLCYG